MTKEQLDQLRARWDAGEGNGYEKISGTIDRHLAQQLWSFWARERVLKEKRDVSQHFAELSRAAAVIAEWCSSKREGK
jgi:hypothetical protein